MMKLYRHSYLKYFCLLLLFAKAFCYVIERTSVCFEEKITCNTDFSDLEEDCEEDIELEENNKLVNVNIYFNFLDNEDKKLRPDKTLDKCSTQYIEFTTPPPEVA